MDLARRVHSRDLKIAAMREIDGGRWIGIPQPDILEHERRSGARYGAGGRGGEPDPPGREGMNTIGFGDDPSPQARVPRRRMVWALSLAFLIQFFLFAAVAHFRFVDAGEGAYLTGCRLLIEGQVPNVDFFFP
jgi:hypothetical protein